ncbi:hypothetical protein CL647_02135 [bacterium]|nr:hypothetical protein [Actinomycetota bacterium]MBE32915.1 hypothetical protein [bacterium]|tara:strand:+ start:72 stop:341 length:270 start_codon:yes stop_codon:yes gene_type:complete
MNQSSDPGYFDKESTKKLLWRLLWGVCIFFLILELFIERHGHFGDHSLDSYFGFFGLLGFFSCLVCILIAKGLGLFLKVKEDYYDRDII